jgi:L-fuconolactonase
MIDTHHHFWRYDAEAYGWIPEDMASIRRDWLPGDLQPVLAANGVKGAVSVQAMRTHADTQQLLHWARDHACIAGVVGWVDLIADDVGDQVDHLLPNPLLVGVRDVVQGEPDGFLDRADFNRGVSAVAKAGLAYDILIVERQLPQAVRFADRHPNARLVLDHLGKPRIDRAELEPWRTNIRELAKRPHVTCKLSGGITETALDWTDASLRPYFEVVLEAFGPSRLMFGSNWPLTEAAGGYARWVQAVRDFIAPLSLAEQHQILEQTARVTYQLEDRP